MPRAGPHQSPGEGLTTAQGIKKPHDTYLTGVVLDTAMKFAQREEDRTMANKICTAFNLQDVWES